MKKYAKLIAAAAALALLIIGAQILYSNLSEKYRPDSPLQTAQDAQLEAGESVDSKQPVPDADNAGTEQSETAGQAEDSALAPDFSMIDQSGQSRNLHGFIGKPIVLNFWASWCGPCKMELPDFQSAYEKYGGEVEFLMVNMMDGMRETKEKASEFMATEGYTLPIYFDALQSGAYTYSVYSLPTTYFISADGKIVAGAEGMLDGESLEKGISMIYEKE